MKIKLPSTQWSFDNVDKFYVEILNDDNSLKEIRKSKTICDAQIKVIEVPDMKTGEYKLHVMVSGKDWHKLNDHVDDSKEVKLLMTFLETLYPHNKDLFVSHRPRIKNRDIFCKLCQGKTFPRPKNLKDNQEVFADPCEQCGKNSIILRCSVCHLIEEFFICEGHSE